MIPLKIIIKPPHLHLKLSILLGQIIQLNLIDFHHVLSAEPSLVPEIASFKYLVAWSKSSCSS